VIKIIDLSSSFQKLWLAAFLPRLSVVMFTSRETPAKRLPENPASPAASHVFTAPSNISKFENGP